MLNSSFGGMSRAMASLVRVENFVSVTWLSRRLCRARRDMLDMSLNLLIDKFFCVIFFV